ncbi:hypothetical protein MtrunA17_Chr3g0094731 [Medicago truncatula]|uniref:Uncharacterized protein n=1 Tax=Medicago truncatula TaxID=3880 RepID=A0A396IME5_MEDTR|nr:hypothetical protein MtrunA17_Chr3g0094731 [Medicago truncatula]
MRSLFFSQPKQATKHYIHHHTTAGEPRPLSSFSIHHCCILLHLLFRFFSLETSLSTTNPNCCNLSHSKISRASTALNPFKNLVLKSSSKSHHHE